MVLDLKKKKKKKKSCSKSKKKESLSSNVTWQLDLFIVCTLATNFYGDLPAITLEIADLSHTPLAILLGPLRTLCHRRLRRRRLHQLRSSLMPYFNGVHRLEIYLRFSPVFSIYYSRAWLPNHCFVRSSHHREFSGLNFFGFMNESGGKKSRIRIGHV
ncbi:hypothetical protein PanWU01x14_256150 [Parasponia andersonii]|uniref:Uncharacterized protein n=1 Tax=Parasponia andersonii TaxID=3476 RepID=A0A2P5BAM4_PARAD|nr:hypothetical protein PanWU01x14_256150 [Parasponia andersonii]